MPEYRRYFKADQTVFVTVVTGQRRRWLAGNHDKSRFLDCLRRVKSHRPFRHLAHVILDDHFHWLLQVNGTDSVSSLVASLKLSVCHDRQRRGLDWRGLWQRRFYDHIIRDESDFQRHLDYIHYNPVRHGYVTMACQWPWSSFHAWVERGVYVHCWGGKASDDVGDAGEP